MIALLVMMAAHSQRLPMVAVASCPPTSQGLRLRGGAVFDGPPEENAILKPDDGDGPDDGTSTWSGLDYVYAAGRRVWLGCSYLDDEMEFVEVTRPVRLCRYAEKRRVTMSCRSAPGAASPSGPSPDPGTVTVAAATARASAGVPDRRRDALRRAPR